MKIYIIIAGAPLVMDTQTKVAGGYIVVFITQFATCYPLMYICILICSFLIVNKDTMGTIGRHST